MNAPQKPQGMATGTTLEHLVDRVVGVSAPLHAAIARFDEAQACYLLAGEPGMALFRRPDTDTITHVAGSPSPDFVPVFERLLSAHRDAIGMPAASDNSHMAALVLLCVYATDDDTVSRLGITAERRKPALVEALGEEDARHDPELAVGDAALRAWTPLSAEHMPEAGVHPAVLEMRFLMQRSSKYVPW